MTIRPSLSLFSCVLVLALASSSTFVKAQTAAPMDASTNTAPAAPASVTAPEPAVAPAPTAPADTNMAPATPEERPSTYTIAKGDSLWTVAHKYGTTVVKLRKANKLKKGALLHPGQVLQIPPASTDTK